MKRVVLAVGALLGFTAVLIAAISGHGWLNGLDAPARSDFSTALRYHQLNAIVILIQGILLGGRPDSLPLRLSATALFAGTVLFSGGLYLRVLGAPSWLGAVTPTGGTLMLLAWLLLLLAALRDG